LRRTSQKLYRNLFISKGMDMIRSETPSTQILTCLEHIISNQMFYRLSYFGVLN